MNSTKTTIIIINCQSERELRNYIIVANIVFVLIIIHGDYRDMGNT